MGTEVEVDCDQFRVSFQRGNSDVAVVAFAGIGRALGAIQTEEFRASFSDTDENCSVIYVIDKRRRWFNDDVYDPLCQILNSLLARFSVRRTVTLGNSMGGFGSIVFGRRLLSCEDSISFCPQSSVEPSIAPFEARWSNFREKITTWQLPDATIEIVSHIKYHMFFGTDDVVDLRHAQRFQNTAMPNVKIYRIPKCGHHVGSYLKERDALKPILQSLIWRQGTPIIEHVIASLQPPSIVRKVTA